jgi:hypothetical protein
MLPRNMATHFQVYPPNPTPNITLMTTNLPPIFKKNLWQI